MKSRLILVVVVLFLSVLSASVLMAQGNRALSLDNLSITVEPETSETRKSGTNYGGFVSSTDDPLAPFANQSVYFYGTGNGSNISLDGASLIYRYRLEFYGVSKLIFNTCKILIRFYGHLKRTCFQP